MVLDRPTGRLRASTAELAALLALAQGVAPDSLHAGDVAALRTAGVLTTDGIDGDVVAVLAGLSRAGVHVELAMTRPSGSELHRVWAAADTATLAAQVGEDAYDLLAVPPSLVVPTLARLMPLAPRPLLPGDVLDVPQDTVGALVGPERAFAANALLAHVPDGWEAAVDDVRAGRVRLHGLAALWVDPAGEPAGRRFSVLATPHGLAEVVALEDGRSGLRPVRSTEVWSMLVELLPADGEVAPDSDVSPVVPAPSGADGVPGGRA
ncbi:hypothetical protein GCM10009866_28680 [Cellulomonas aerilata]